MRKDRYECPRFMPGGSVISSVMAGVLLFSLVALSPSARTATFDETVSAPRDLSGAELRSKARVFFTPFEIGSLSMIDVVRDSAKRAELTDLWWHLSRFVDERKSLADLASYGVTPNADASYSIDLNRFPQWDSLDQRMLTGLNTGSLDRTLADLKHRGFRDSDIEGLRKYLKQHNPELLAIAAADPVTEGFAAKIKRQRAIGRKLAADEMMAYDYQMAHATNEAYRAWEDTH